MSEQVSPVQSKKREQFSSRIGFILAAAGSAVGIGNLVGFPVNAAKNGGAAFLLIYAIFIVAICLPVMIAEMSLGRSTRSNPIGAYKKAAGSNAWKIAGWFAVITPFMIAVFYQVLTVWLLAYLIGALTGNLAAMAEPDYFGAFINSNGVFAYLIVLTLLLGCILNFGVQQGIERLSKTLMPVLIVMLVVLTVFVLTLPNAWLGVKYYLIPDLTKISPQAINSALGHAFFSLSLGMGIMITYGSYMQRNQSIASNAKAVALVDTLVAFMAGLLILPAIFVFDSSTNTTDLSSSSVSLVFTFLPKIFLSMQDNIGYLGASIFATVFFLQVFIAALTSQVSILQVPLAAFKDQLGFSRKKSVLWLGACAALLVLASTVSFGMVEFFSSFISYAGSTKSFFDLIVDVFYETILPLNGLIICLFVSKRWKKHNLENECKEGDDAYANSFTKKYVDVALTTFVPVILFFVFLNTVAIKFFNFNVFG